MPTLFIPPRVARELRQATDSFREDVLRSVVLEDTDPLLIELNRMLQDVDPRVVLVRAREAVVVGLPMRPGYYHLLRDNSDTGAPMTVLVLEGAHGEFVDPTSRILEKLAAGDMRERRNLERFKQTELDEWVANEKEKADGREERRDHLTDLVNAYTRTSVSTTDARPWTQNNQPSAQREAGARKQAKKGQP